MKYAKIPRQNRDWGGAKVTLLVCAHVCNELHMRSLLCVCVCARVREICLSLQHFE